MVGGAQIVPDSGGQVSSLIGPPNGSGFTAEQPWQILRSGSAVEMWFAATDCSHATLASFTREAISHAHISLLEFAAQFPSFVIPAGFAEPPPPTIGEQPAIGRLRYLMRWPATSNAANGVNLVSRPGTQPFVWHHVIGQQREREMSLYVDGQRLCSGVCDEIPAENPGMLIFGYAWGHDENEAETKLVRQFRGRLAHIALYDRTLGEQEIRQHARLGGKEQP
jgi:hypothetical protein